MIFTFIVLIISTFSPPFSDHCHYSSNFHFHHWLPENPSPHDFFSERPLYQHLHPWREGQGIIPTNTTTITIIISTIITIISNIIIIFMVVTESTVRTGAGQYDEGQIKVCIESASLGRSFMSEPGKCHDFVIDHPLFMNSTILLIYSFLLFKAQDLKKKHQ